MNNQGMYLSWIVVKDIQAAIAFYTKTLGLQLQVFEEKFGWAELAGSEGGAVLGIAQENDFDKMPAGQNAIVTMSVPDLVKAREELVQKGAKLVGEIMEVPGHVKLQMVVDLDGNHIQIVQKLD